MRFVRAVVSMREVTLKTEPPKVVFIATVQQLCEDGKRRVRERFESEDKRALLNRVFAMLTQADFAVTIMRKR